MVLKTCRAKGITFGNIYVVLGQIVMTRVLCRRYVRGEIDQTEWDFRRKEPMTTVCPVNLRPFLEKDWYEQGGASNVSLAVGVNFYTLPFMPLGSATALAPGDLVPTLNQLLSPDRFWSRCESIKKQAIGLFKSAYFFEKIAVSLPVRLNASIERAANWQKGSNENENGGKEENALSAVEQARAGFVVSLGLSTSGNVRLYLWS